MAANDALKGRACSAGFTTDFRCAVVAGHALRIRLGRCRDDAGGAVTGQSFGAKLLDELANFAGDDQPIPGCLPRRARFRSSLRI